MLKNLKLENEQGFSYSIPEAKLRREIYENVCLQYQVFKLFRGGY